MMSSKQSSPLYQKYAVFYGDSLCYARGERGESTEPEIIRRSGYAGRIATKYDMTLSVHAYSGWTLSDKQGGLHTRVRKQLDALSDEERGRVDYVVLEGGVNDIIHEVPLGEPSDGDFDTATFTGALETMLSLAKQTYPNAVIGYLIVYRMPLAEHWYNNEAIPHLRDIENVSRYVERICRICEKWGVPYLNLYENDRFNDEVFEVTVTARTSPDAKLLADGLHMTARGYDTIAPVIAEWMESL